MLLKFKFFKTDLNLSMKRKNLIAQCILNFGLGSYWMVENFWINMYWSREINPDLGYISAMVSLSAVVGVMTMILIGALSDSSKSNFGRRKIFILWGGIFGGISMFLFPFTKQINYLFGLTYAIVYAIVIDIFITFLGDCTTPTRMALFNEHTEKKERGKMNSIIGMAAGLGSGIIMGMYILDIFDNKVFFYVGGILIISSSIISIFLFEDPPIPNNERTFKQCIREITRRDSYKNNKDFYFLLFALFIQFLGINFYSNYINVFAENVMFFSPMEVGFISVLGAIVGMAITIPCAIISDKYGRKRVILISLILYLIFCCCLTFFGMISFWNYAIFSALMSACIGSADAVATVWINDVTPSSMKGSLLAYLHVVKVIPMTPGSILGAYIGMSLAPSGVLYSNLMFIFGGLTAFTSILIYKKVKESIK